MRSERRAYDRDVFSTMLAQLMTSELAWRGQFVDLWTIPHIFSGIYIAFITLHVFMLSEGEGFGVALAIGIGWEIFERLTGISKTEKYTNSLTDILTAQTGYVLGVWLWQKVTRPRTRTILIIVIGILYLCIFATGFAAFKYYG